MSKVRRPIPLDMILLVMTQHLGLFASSREGTEGTDFSGIREKTAGDSYRHQDWARSLATGRDFIRVFEDERSMRVAFLVDCSRSTSLASGISSKIAAELFLVRDIASYAFEKSAVASVIPFAGRVECVSQELANISDLDGALKAVARARIGEHTFTNFNAVFRYAQSEIERPSLLIILSDLRGTFNWAETFTPLLPMHAVVVCVVEDRRDEEGIPGLGYAKGIESGTAVKTFGRMGRQQETVWQVLKEHEARRELVWSRFSTRDTEDELHENLVELFGKYARLLREQARR